MSKKKKPVLFEEYWQAIAYCVRNKIEEYRVIKSPHKPQKYSKSWEGWHVVLKNNKLVSL